MRLNTFNDDNTKTEVSEKEMCKAYWTYKELDQKCVMNKN